MTALSADRNTPSRAGVDYVHPMAAAAKVFAGGITMLDASGNAKAGATATGLVAAGVAQEFQDNTLGAAGDKVIKVRKGVYGFATDGSITRASIGKTAYVVDDQTVAATDGTNTRSPAGTIDDFDGALAWIRF